jgi:hypothetical protein
MVPIRVQIVPNPMPSGDWIVNAGFQQLQAISGQVHLQRLGSGFVRANVQDEAPWR